MTSKQAKDLGALLRNAREALGLNQRDTAQQADLAPTWLAYLESGRSLEPMPDRLARLAELLAVDPAEIDRVSGNYLAHSLPTLRTYFRSKGAATEAELEELERVITEVRAKYGQSGLDDRPANERSVHGAAS